ncbi:MAG TPA: hypothetical protein VGW35_16385 [Methylomirabilota bacterium]|jgi:hypothetical protein|nr:hypothetical protein [Methylomirabilota bacterium]
MKPTRPRRPEGSSRRSRLTRRQRRQLVHAAGALVGTAIAAAGGWLYASARPAEPPPPTVSRPAMPAAASPGAGLSLGLPAPGDLAVQGGILEVPTVDFTELLPGCHR